MWRLPFRWAAAPATMTMPATCGEVDVAGAVGRVQECPSLPVARRVLSQAVVKTDLLTLTAHFRDACPGKRYLDCDLDDPAGQSVGAVRPIRDDIVRRVRTLLSEILDY
ncbi:hypothetical protein SAMN05216266_11110 [Amycolatopsis marina]|uniref:Uncharacterized protein n=1 Tax=Amycolatopsis marina TaxID=490629 RepID=A0A1I1B252_9PSEU|nr:hypothetical protein [Amycolatopsis marina]SFB42710.1 hypothetical protein SAMN05216266_11110 [Amycolatopsis marina]